MFKLLKILIFHQKKIDETIENETKEREAGFLGMLLSALEPSLLGNMLTGKGILRAGYGNKQGKEIWGTGYGSKKFLFRLMLLLILKYRSIIRMRLDLMEFILEAICLKT